MLLISGLAIAGVTVIVAAITGYAIYNLTALITRHQARIVHQVSDALGRPVKYTGVTAKVGLGLAIEVDGLQIADDPAFSNTPFLTAAQASFDVKFLPLLRGHIKVVSLELSQPNIRILRNADGRLNVDSIRESPNTGAAVHSSSGGPQLKEAQSLSRHHLRGRAYAISEILRP